MIRVKNKKAVRKLSQKSLYSNRVRNTIAVFAIALTTMLFMALFTIAGTMVHSFQQETFRQVGSSGHGVFKNLTLQQKEELEKDPLIQASGGRLMLGIGSGEAFRKVQAELSYMEPVYRECGFCVPEHGSVPKEGTKEIACDTRFLNCIGVKPKAGAQVRLTYEIGGVEKKEITDTFLLSGWWEYDPACMVSMAVLPKSYVEEMAGQHTRMEGDDSDYTGVWDLEILLNSSMHIGEDMCEILQNHGFQCEDPSTEGYINIGVNWAYAGAQLAANMDIEMIIGVAAMLVLILFTGYLIIYNVFQISVSGDIRFYGLLKMIGTTGRQIRGIIRRQAFLLSAAGIPLGLLAGGAAGTVIAPLILSTYNTGKTYPIMSLWFAAAAAVFSFVTICLSCAKPGRMAAKVSPIEALRYTDAAAGGKQQKKSRAGGRPFRMAAANLGRNKRKFAIVVISMALAVVLLQLTDTFVRSFDMDKYLRPWVVSDFILGDASYFRTGVDKSHLVVPEEDIQNIKAAGGITEDGRIYGHNGDIFDWVTEDVSRAQFREWMSEEEIDEALLWQERDASGRLAANAQIYGMEDYPLSQLQVIDGDLADVYDTDKHAIAAVYTVDDYGSPLGNTQWAKVGDQVTLHYVYEWEYINDETGKVIAEEDLETYPGAYTEKPKEYQDVTYEVAACVTIKNAMSYRFYGAFEYVLNAEVFCRDSRTSDVMTYLFNTTQESNAKMQNYLEDYTNTENLNLDFESKQVYVQEFEEFRNMFLIVGSVLSFVIGLVGVLNFLNAVLTSMNARKREFAMLQSIGMTGRQLKEMVIWEGLIYGGSAVLVSLAVSLLLMPVMGKVVNGVFWFCTYHITVRPIVIVIPVFALLGILLPLVSYRHVEKMTIVERLRESE